MQATVYHWIFFNLIIIVLLACELRRFILHPHAMKTKEALWLSFGWIALALFFNVWIYYEFGANHALDFFTGYLIEKSLSVDNLFIFLIIFSHFNVPDTAKHQVLFYGVLGAIVMRALLIWGGIALMQNFTWIFLAFGVLLIITGIRLAFQTKQEEEYRESAIFSWLTKRIPFINHYVENSFIVKYKGQWVATPLLGVLILIETTDLIFALDSVPAIIGITTEPFIVYTSNILAILGLRSLFFALEGMMRSFHLLHYALAFILVFIGSKMVLSGYVHVPTWLTLVVLLLSLSLAVLGSLAKPSEADRK